MRLLTTAFLALLLTGCATKNYTLMQTPEQEVTTAPFTGTIADYIIQPSDRVQVISYDHKDLMPVSLKENGILLDSRGYASLPLIHRVKLSGLTQNQASKKLERLYSKYLKSPSLTVEALNKKVYVLGEVKKPGAVILDKDQLTLLEAISQSGDLSDNAVRDNIIIVSRTANGKMRMRKVDLTKFDAMQASNMMLYPNDIVYVQPNNWKQLRVTADNINSITKVISSAATPYIIFK